MALNDTMDMKTVRRANLRRILEGRQLGPKDLVQTLGKTYPYWRDLLRDDFKSFGEKIARELEEGLGLPSGVLDEPPTRGRVAHPLSPGPATLSPQLVRWGDMKSMEPEELPGEFRGDLEDDAMAPEARAGWRVELSKALEPRFGDDVLVRLGNGEYHYRRYRQNPSGGWIAAALDPDFASYESVNDPAMRIVAVMAFVLRPRRAAP